LDPDFDKDRETFFGFSFEDMGNHDTNATVAFIRQKTGKASIGVIGHSLGATQFLIAPQTGISVFVSLGATSVLNHTENKIFKMLGDSDYYVNLLKEYKIVEVFPANDYVESFFTQFCQLFSSFWESLFDDIFQHDTDYLNVDRIDELMGHFPSGTSTKNFLHMGQIYKNKRFQRYDYGLELNRKIYNQDVPPLFDLTKVSNSMKIILMVGEADLDSTPADSHWLRNQLGSKVIYYGSYRIGHISYLLGNDISYMTKLLELFKANAWA
jgi:pimeloyl-ACP methyl ester carboxylesterase